METVLTIDFDIIMGRSIEVYNILVPGDVDVLPGLEEGNPLIRYCDPDLYMYYVLTKYIKNMKDKNVPIYFIDSHEKVLDYVKEKSNIINIDHHHDLGYNRKQLCEPIRCSNWAYIGLKKDIINNYIGMNDYNSDTFLQDIEPELEKRTSIVSALEANIENIRTPDKIVICASYPGITLNNRNLFLVGEELFKKEI